MRPNYAIRSGLNALVLIGLCGAASAQEAVLRGNPSISARVDSGGETRGQPLPFSVPVYRNINSFLGVGFEHGDVEAFDDIVCIGSGRLSAVTLAIANLGAVGTYTGGDIRLRIARPAGQFTPGEILLDETLALDELFGGQLAVAPGSVTLATLNGFAGLGIDVGPEELLVGLTYLEPGGVQDISKLGQGVFDPPTIGSSSDGVFFGGEIVALNGPSLSLGWQLGVVSPTQTADYQFDLVPLPTTDIDLFRDSTAFSNNGQIVVHCIDDANDPVLYIGDAVTGRLFAPPEPASSGSLGPVSINDEGDVFYCAVFAQNGFPRGGYMLAAEEQESLRVTSSSPFVSAPVLYGRGDGGMAGMASLSSGVPSGRYLVNFPGEQAPPVILARPNAVDPSSDILEMDLFCTAANEAGQVVQLVTLVGGGQQYRLYEADGSGYFVLASDSVADADSEIAELPRFVTPGLNDLGHVVFVGIDHLDRPSIYRFDGTEVTRSYGPEQLQLAGITRVVGQDLSLNNHGRIALIADPEFTEASNFSLWTAPAGEELELVYRSIPGASSLQTIDAGALPIEFIDGNAIVNDRGEILFVGFSIDTGSIQEYAFVAMPSTCPGDATGDGEVDLADLNLVLARFGQSGAGIPGDIDGNNMVDLADLNQVLANFGTGC